MPGISIAGLLGREATTATNDTTINKTYHCKTKNDNHGNNYDNCLH
jgi:hypothetical protein